MLLGVDVGGTFTDAVLIDGHGVVHSAKVASTPSRESDGVMRSVLSVMSQAGADARDVERFAHGMTVATNALLQGRTARTALIATEGFTDVIELGRQARAHLYRLSARAPEPLVPHDLRFAARERVVVNGTLLELDPDEARRLVERVARSGAEAVAVCLLHSYADPRHEQALGALLEQIMPEASVSLSSELVGTFREYERTATTALDAALSPALSGYLSSLVSSSASIGLPEPLVMQSSGGLTDAGTAASHAALTVLSGPAGGVEGALALARACGEPRVLCFDMGGTSCDVCVIEQGQVAESAERTIAGRPLALAALDIHTVGAGGGSIAWRDGGGALRVGPQSAGAEPGPACYGRGGELPTVTDANLVLGRLPAAAPLADGLLLDPAAALEAVRTLASRLGLGASQCAEGIVRVAETQMLAALRVMTVERGIDPRDYALMAFGGAGALHAAALAGELGITHVISPRAGGVLSALGLAAAAPRRDVARTMMLALDARSDRELTRARAELAARACALLAGAAVELRVRHELRYSGQSHELPVVEHLPVGDAGAGLDADALRQAFAAEHERRYGHSDPDGEIVLVTVRASALGDRRELAPPAAQPSASQRSRREIVLGGERLQALVLTGEPTPGESVGGPALWEQAQSTLLIPGGWQAMVDDFGSIHMSAAGEA